MAQTSRLPSAKDALQDLLEARAAIGGNPLQNVPIDMGWPGDLLKNEHVWIQEDASSQFENQVTGSGPQLRGEVGVITVEVWVNTPGNSYTASRDRAFALAGEVLIAVRADADLGDQVFSAEVVALRERPSIGENTRALFLEIDVEFRAELTA